MKRCPECRRDYHDDSLSFCLDDGSSLLDGPASLDEPPTAILSEPPASAGGQALSESATRPQIHTTEAEPRTTVGHSSEKRSFSAHRTAKPLVVLGLALLLLIAGFFGYRYFSPAKQIESIAVMPFVNESGNADVEYLSDGMTETLISSLSQLPNLNVKPRSSVFRYKGTETNPNTIGKELNVQAILNGRVAQRGQEVSLFVELIDVALDKVVWSQQYNRKQSDLATLQSDIARDVSSKLKTKLSGADEAKVTKVYTTNPEAYQLYLKARFQRSRVTAQSLRQAVEFYQQAIENDPNYALAYSGLAQTIYYFPALSIASPRDSAPRAKAAALRALELDDSLAEPHVVLGRYFNDFEWDRVGSEREMRRAIELEPTSAEAHSQLSFVLYCQKRFDEAIVDAKLAAELDPLSMGVASTFGEALVASRRYDEAITQMKSVLSLDPNFAYAHSQLGWAFYAKGLYRESIASFQRAYELDDDPWIKGMIALGHAKLGQRDEAVKQLEWLKLESTKRYVTNFTFALVYIALDQKDEALTSLEKDVAERGMFTTLYSIDPALDEVRADPRFKGMLKRLNLPE